MGDFHRLGRLFKSLLVDGFTIRTGRSYSGLAKFSDRDGSITDPSLSLPQATAAPEWCRWRRLLS